MSLTRRPAAALLAAVLVCGALAACSTTTAGSGTAARVGATASSSAGGSSATAGGLPPQPAADFSDCSSLFNFDAVNFPAGRRSKLTFTCARVTVPLDYSKPDGPTIPVQLLKVHDKENTSGKGSLVVNPGGPGASGVELAVGLAVQMSDTMLRNFDIVGFDPRGVGLSSPVRCISDAEKDVLNASNADVRTAGGFEKARDLAKSVADSCSTKYGAALAQYDTVNTARDIDQIRQALGESKLTYLGFSYGTELGAQYAHLFPQNVRVSVLDGGVNPLTDDITSFANQIDGFEKSFDQFAAACKDKGYCSALPDPRRAVYDLVATADASPIPSSAPGEKRTATGAIVLTGVLSALYSSSRWPDLAQAIVDGGKGDAKRLFALADEYNQRYPDGTYSNIADANATISCNDSKAGPDDATIRSTADAWSKKYPMFGLWAAQSLFTCQVWQPHRTVPELPKAPTSNTVLVIGNLHDPATPYQGAKDLAKTLGNAALLTWDGEGHTSYLQGSTCVDGWVERYLIDGTVPPAGTTCPR